jgi:hypothetical protein|tara:strand:+ start:199 stop:504 length:306 start_codon:yes stop_codon:yes gene_type:complete
MRKIFSDLLFHVSMHWHDEGRGPTLEYLSDKLGITRSGAGWRVKSAIAMGYLMRVPGRHYDLRLAAEFCVDCNETAEVQEITDKTDLSLCENCNGTGWLDA